MKEECNQDCNSSIMLLQSRIAILQAVAITDCNLRNSLQFTIAIKKFSAILLAISKFFCNQVLQFWYCNLIAIPKSAIPIAWCPDWHGHWHGGEIIDPTTSWMNLWQNHLCIFIPIQYHKINPPLSLNEKEKKNRKKRIVEIITVSTLLWRTTTTTTDTTVLAYNNNNNNNTYLYLCYIIMNK